MKKIPTLFVRQFENPEFAKCLNEVTPGCEWVLNGEGYATEKLDGTCCLIQDNKIYKRFDYKKGRKLPEGAIPCQEKPDAITGHFPHWVLCDKNNPSDKWHIEAFNKYGNSYENGTYELCGPHFQRNPYHLSDDTLFRHGKIIINNIPRTYAGIRDYLSLHYIEGIVFYRGNGEMCKIKRSDFGFNWNKKDDDIDE